jgi:hypothetical protein
MMEEISMRFMLTVPEGARPDERTMARMMEYNKSLKKAGVLLAIDGLFPYSTGARITFPDGKATVTDGPFPEAKEIIGGYWIIQVSSREEAIEWAKRAPMSNKGVIFVRQIADMADMPESIRQVMEGGETVNGGQ